MFLVFHRVHDQVRALSVSAYACVQLVSITDSQRNVQLLTCTEHDQPVILVC